MTLRFDGGENRCSDASNPCAFPFVVLFAVLNSVSRISDCAMFLAVKQILDAVGAGLSQLAAESHCDLPGPDQPMRFVIAHNLLAVDDKFLADNFDDDVSDIAPDVILSQSSIYLLAYGDEFFAGKSSVNLEPEQLSRFNGTVHRSLCSSGHISHDIRDRYLVFDVVKSVRIESGKSFVWL